MDGEAISTAFATVPGPDCIREVVPKLGHRLKALLEESQVLRAQYSNEMAIICLKLRIQQRMVYLQLDHWI